MEIVDKRNTNVNEEAATRSVKMEDLTVQQNSGEQPLTEEESKELDDIINGDEGQEIKMSEDNKTFEVVKKEEKEVEKQQSMTVDGVEYTGEDMKCLLELTKMIKEHKSGSIYNKMTPKLKNEIKKAATELGIFGMQGLQMYARSFITQMITDSEIDTAYAKLQDDIKKVSQIPDQMDLYGEAVQENMLLKSLLKSMVYKNKGSEKDANLYEQVASVYLDVFFFKPFYQHITDNFTLTNDFFNEVKVNRAVDDLDFALDKLGVTKTDSTSIRSMYKRLHDRYKDIINFVIITAADYFYKTKDKADNIFDKEIAFVFSQLMASLSFMKKDKGQRTKFGNHLIYNMFKFSMYCDYKMGNPVPEGEEGTQIDWVNKERAKAWDDAVEGAKKIFDEKYLPVLEKKDEEVKEEAKEAEPVAVE